MRASSIIAVTLMLSVSGCATPSGTRQTANQTDWLALGEAGRLNGVEIRPLVVLGDSRCPQKVRCVHQGDTKIEVAYADRSPVRTLQLTTNIPVPVTGGRIVLSEVKPNRTAGAGISPDSYRFKLRFDPR